MRIGIDGSCLANRRGFGRFARESLEALGAIPSGHDFVVFVDESGPKERRVKRTPVTLAIGVLPLTYRQYFSSSQAYVSAPAYGTRHRGAALRADLRAPSHSPSAGDKTRRLSGRCRASRKGFPPASLRGIPNECD